MNGTQRKSQGFTLIASMLLLLLMSGIAIGLLMMVNTESRVGNNDLQNNLAYHAAEGAIEKMTSDLSTTFSNIESPKASDICALSGQTPNTPGITYPDYSVTPQSGCSAKLTTQYGQIQGGAFQNLYAQIIPINLMATAQQATISKEQVSMTRTVQVALIPVFQFGVFSQGDLGFFSSPTLDFQGRVHTNGDLYVGVANGYNLVFHDKVTVWGNVINQVFPNGADATDTSNNDNGNVYLPKQAGGCDNLSRYPGTYCVELQQNPNQSSVTAGATSSQNGAWSTVSTGTYHSMIVDGNYGNKGGTGAANLSLPFVSGTTQPYEIIRRPPVNEPLTSVLAQSRLGNQAQIRVLLSDKEADLHLVDWNGDASQDILLGGAGGAKSGDPGDTTGRTVNGTAGYYWAWANRDAAAKDPGGATGTSDPDFSNQICSAAVLPVAVNCLDSNQQWPLIGGWLLVEVKWASDSQWHGVTKEWLAYGFARGIDSPDTEPPTVANPVHPNAILIFQQMADRNGDHKVVNGTAGSYKESANATGSPFNWYPINLYDAREGENWDTVQAAGTCTANGLMNAVELDVGNLRQWLRGTGAYTAGTGKNVDYVTQNGYIFYFSDRRGEQYMTGVTTLVGEYGFEDTINLAANGVPDGKLEPAMPVPPNSGRTAQSPEDVNDSGVLDVYGVKGVGDAFSGSNATDTDTGSKPTPFAHRFACYTTGRKNRVTGARHVLKLIDGGYVGTQSNLPTRADDNTGGFTVGSENPVYIQGDYNSSAADPMWNNANATEPNHAAAAVIADAVTLLSNNWQDAGYPSSSPVIYGSLANPTNPSSGSTPNRMGSTTYYRVAVAAGKTMNFTNPSGSPDGYFGTDGGLHNFLRFLEDWSNQTLNYKGSLVSLYWSTYATGTFKCCNTVYHPPNRNYVFDPLFSEPAGLPPGTPMFKDIDNLSYRQTYTARTN